MINCRNNYCKRLIICDLVFLKTRVRLVCYLELWNCCSENLATLFICQLNISKLFFKNLRAINLTLWNWSLWQGGDADFSHRRLVYDLLGNCKEIIVKVSLISYLVPRKDNKAFIKFPQSKVLHYKAN